jgi:hypothetical protein
MLLSYAFSLIADNSDSSTFSSFSGSPAINNAGTVAFHALLRLGGEGTYTSSDGSYTTIANTNGPFSSLGTPAIDPGGTVAFQANLRTGGSGVFKGSGGPITHIAATGVLFSGLNATPTINAGGTVAFRAEFMGGGQGVVTGSGGPVTILASTDGQPFSGFGTLTGNHPSINAGGAVAFVSTLAAGGEGIFTVSPDGAITTITDTSGGFFSDLLNADFPNGNRPVMNDDGMVVLSGRLVGGGAGIFTGSGGPLTTIATRNDTDSVFSAFYHCMVNNHGTVAFQALLRAGGTGIYTGPDPDADRVIATGDPLFGSIVTDIRAPFVFGSQGQGLNDAGQLVFDAELADGRIVVARADPDGDSAASAVRPGRFVAFLDLSGSAVSPGVVWTKREPSAARAVAGPQGASASLPLITPRPIQPQQSARPQPAHWALANPSRSGMLDLVFASFESISDDNQFAKELTLAG